MRTKNFLKHLILGAVMLTIGTVAGQVTTTGNVAAGTSDFLGWDITSPANDFPLMVRHDGNFPIQFFTNATQRMQLYQSQTPTINGFTVATDGFLSLSGDPAFFGGPGPFTRLHLADNSNLAILNAQEFAYRPWQRNGITFTGNADHGYLGQEHNGTDTTDMVLLWSNDFGVGEFAPDHLSIRFASNYLAAAPTGASSMRGLEAMRFFPVDRTRVNVGVGDYIAGQVNDPLVTEPTEILDILDGRLRIRELPEASGEVNATYMVMVVDDAAAPSAERGVVKWVAAGDLASGCDWVVQAPIPHVSSVYDPSGCTWDKRHGVGVGVQFPKFKLHVEHTEDEILGPTAIYGDCRFDYEQSQSIYGVHGLARTVSEVGSIAAMQAHGVFGKAMNGKYTTGVLGIGTTTTATGGSAQEVIGVHGLAEADSNATLCIGVRGKAGGATGGNNWAGYFDGFVVSAGYATFSDGSLKTDVQDLENASQVLSQLRPKQYSYRSEELPDMGLPTGVQFGFLAEELGEVLPELVHHVAHPAQLDSTGAEVVPGREFDVVNYQGLIPFLVASMQQQNATIDALHDELRALQAQVNGCCAADVIPRSSMGEHSEENETLTGDPRKLSIQPNPFNEQTTLSYTLERNGRMQLVANSTDGKELRVLQEAILEAGSYQYEWNTADLAPGMYYVTLLVDGQPLVKKAVKVAH